MYLNINLYRSFLFMKKINSVADAVTQFIRTGISKKRNS